MKFAQVLAAGVAAALFPGVAPLTAQSSLAALGAREGLYNILDFGAVPGGADDSTAAIQKAIDAASTKGGVVFVPAGRWLCKGHLVLRMGVHLAGINRAPQSWEPQPGSILMPVEGRGEEGGPAFIEMRSSTSVTGLTVYYPEQQVSDIRPYPWTIQIRANPADAKEVSFDSTVANVTLINSYNGIRTGPTENGRHRIMGVHGTVLRRGIFIDWTGDIGRIENVQFHSHFWAHPTFSGNWDKVFAYMQRNLEAFVFGRTDWEYVTNTFVFPARVGYRFIKTENGSANGQFLGIGADATETAVVVESIQRQIEDPTIAGLSAHASQRLFTVYFAAFAAGRLAASWIQKKVRPAVHLGVNLAAAAVCVVLAMTTHGAVAVAAVTALGFFVSIFFPTLYALAIEGLGPLTGQASGLLTMGFLGCAVLPVLQGRLADGFGLQRSYAVRSGRISSALFTC